MRAKYLIVALLFGVVGGGGSAVGQNCVYVEPHDWMNETKLGLAYIFNPKLATDAEVFHLYSGEDASTLIGMLGSRSNSSDGNESEWPDLMISWVNPEADHALIVREPDPRIFFSNNGISYGRRDSSLTADLGEQYSEWLVYLAADREFEEIDVTPDHMLIHWPGEYSVSATEWERLFDTFCRTVD